MHLKMGMCDSCKKPENSSSQNIQNSMAQPIYPNNSNTYKNEAQNINPYDKTEINKIIIEQNVITGKVSPISRVKEEKIIEQMKNSVCKIYTNEKFGTGFLCLIPFPNKDTPHRVLITNKNLINEEQLQKQKKIDITLDNDREEKTIYLTSERKVYSSKKYDITFIEILPEEINLNQFLEIDSDFLGKDFELLKAEIQKEQINIYIIQYINETSCKKSYGIINDIHEDIIEHNSSPIYGGPILLMETQRLIGINIERGKGILLRESVKEFYSYFSNKNENKALNNYMDCYYIIKNGGEFNLLHDYYDNKNEFISDPANIDGKSKRKFLEDNINIYIDSQPIQFNYKYRTNNNKIHVKFVFKKILNDLSLMFFNCQNLESINLSSYDMSNITDMSSMFSGCSNLQSANLSSLKTKNEIDMANMFSGCSLLKNVEFPIAHKINSTSIKRLFFYCSSIESVDLSSFNTIKVFDMNRLFSQCNSLKKINISSFNTINVLDMSRMFAFCMNLKSVDLSNFDTRNVQLMNDMFFDCRSLITLDLSSFNTSKVTHMNYMFMGCLSLKSINLSSFNTINVVDMSSMFFGCQSLKNLDLSSFKTPNVICIDLIFSGCVQLELIDLSSFTTNKVEIGSQNTDYQLLLGMGYSEINEAMKLVKSNIFFGCPALKSIKCKDKLILDMFKKIENQN